MVERPPDPVALVTGAAGGIGTAVLQALDGAGFATVAFDRVAPDTACARAVDGDLRDADDRARAVAAAREVGTLSAVINLAGVNLWCPFLDLDLDDARALFEVNVWGTAALLQGAGPDLIASGRGAVVTVTSINGELGIVDGSAYGMSKAALAALTRTLAVEWARFGVRVNAVAPAIVPTPMNEAARERPGFVENKVANIPLGRMIRAEEVAAAVTFLASPVSSGITGETLHTDGGAVIRG